MVGRRNLLYNLNKGLFYQRMHGVHRFYSSQALADSNQSEIRPKEDPFSLVEDEVSQIGNSVREQITKAAELMIPDRNLALEAANYYFKRFPVEKFRPTVPLLMAQALDTPIYKSLRAQAMAQALHTRISKRLQARQTCVVKNIEIIDAAVILRDGLLLSPDKLGGVRSIYPLSSDQIRGIESLRCILREQYSVMAGNFLLVNALNEVEKLVMVHSLFTKEINDSFRRSMYRQQTPDRYNCMKHCLNKIYYKTASSISKSCEAIAILAQQNDDVSKLAFEYGKNLGFAYELANDVLEMNNLLRKGVVFNILCSTPMVFAKKEFPELRKVLDNLDYEYYCDYPSSIEVIIEALEYVRASKGIVRTIELAKKYANRAKEIIREFPNSDDVNVLTHRKALIDLSDWTIQRIK